MTTKQMLTPVELQRLGFEALVDALGPVDAIRFLRLYDHGRGDYTAERYTWLGDQSVEEIAAEIFEHREAEQRERGHGEQ